MTDLIFQLTKKKIEEKNGINVRINFDIIMKNALQRFDGHEMFVKNKRAVFVWFQTASILQ